MNVDEIEATIQLRFSTEWTRSEPYTFLNQGGFSNGVTEPPNNSTWLRLSVLHGQAEQVEMGNQRRIRRPGVVSLQIFIPSATGTGTPRAVAKAFADIFETRTVSSIVYRAMDYRHVGVFDAWVQYNAVIPFHADDFRST